MYFRYSVRALSEHERYSVCALGVYARVHVYALDVCICACMDACLRIHICFRNRSS